MYYINEYFENSKEYDYEQLPNIIKEDLYVQNLFKFLN